MINYFDLVRVFEEDITIYIIMSYMIFPRLERRSRNNQNAKERAQITYFYLSMKTTKNYFLNIFHFYFLFISLILQIS
jgi:uncharacterized membrane protein